MQPLVRSKSVRTEIADHAAIGPGLRGFAPGRHAVQDQSMRQEDLSRSRMDLDALTTGKGLFTRAMVNIGDILLTPLPGCDTGEALGEAAAHDFMRPFPNHERRGVGIKFDHGDAENETVILAQVPALLRAFA
jgi:hypothetical protein